MAEITFGSNYEFRNAFIQFPDVAVLDSTHIAVIYQVLTDNRSGYVKVGTISGGTITYGSAYKFSTGTNEVNYLSISALDSTHFVIGWSDADDTSGHCIIGVVSNDDEVAFGSDYSFRDFSTIGVTVLALDSTHFAVSYSGGGSQTRIGIVANGDEISYGSEYEMSATGSNWYPMVKIDSTHYVIVFAASGESVIATVSGSPADNVTFGTVYSFNGASDVSYPSVSLLDSTHFVIAYCDKGNTDYGATIIGEISSVDTITYGDKDSFSGSEVAYDIAVVALNDTNFIINYRLNYSTSQSLLGTVSGTDSTFGETDIVFSSNSSLHTNNAKIDSTNFVVVFADEGGSYHGQAVIGTLAATQANTTNFFQFIN